MSKGAPIQRLIILVVFSIAMGFLESAVVVYARWLYYPDGFSFPLQPMPSAAVITELLREAATLVMLVTVGWLSAHRKLARFGGFLIAFGSWDIFYYIFLWLLIGWPPSLLTWDVLFLIPTTWTGPVIAPVVNAATMILLGSILFLHDHPHPPVRVLKSTWILLFAGSVITIAGYTWEYSEYILREYGFSGWFLVGDPSLMEYAYAFIPQQFPWWLFLIGEVFFMVAIILIVKRTRNKTNTFA